jgi:hypothetical protein
MRLTRPPTGPDPFVIPWQGRQLCVRHDDSRLAPAGGAEGALAALLDAPAMRRGPSCEVRALGRSA